MSYKIGIVGAARRHQGIGPYIARVFDQLGHEVTAIIGTSQTSIDKTISHLKQQYGISTQGYTNLKSLLDQHKIDILVISSPPDTHLTYLGKALQNGLHVFCEKPLWWPNNENLLPPLQDYQLAIQDCLDLAKQKQCYIHLNTQWPYTLRDFNRLYPGIITNEITQFAMSLSPQSQGVTMLVDAASHGLSMLYQLVGVGEINNIAMTQTANKDITVSFDFQHQRGIIKTTFSYIKSHAIPKPASFTINNCKVDRTVSLPEYQIKLQSNKRSVAIQDPLESSIQDCISCIEAGVQSDEAVLLLGAHHLYQLIERYQ